MAHINPALPAVGDLDWGGVIDTAISTVVTEVNSKDDRVAALESAAITASTTAPSSPRVNQLWIDLT